MSPDGPSDQPGEDDQPPHATTAVACDADLPLCLGVLRRGTGDPTYQVASDGAIWRGCLTPHGPGTVRVRRGGPVVEIAAWGDGAAWLVKQGPAMIGAEDDSAGFAELIADHRLLREAHRGHPGLRMIRTETVSRRLGRPAVRAFIASR